MGLWEMELNIYPKLTKSAAIAGLRSTTSRELVAIIGEAPTANVAFAESLMTTLFVIYNLVSA